MQEHVNHVSEWILSTFCEVYVRKMPSDILELCWEKAKVFEKSLQM